MEQTQTENQSAALWQWVEAGLLLLTLSMRLYLFRERTGRLYGFDAGAFIETAGTYGFFEQMPPLTQFLTSYHPPFSFLLVRLISTLTGAPLTISSQFMSFMSLLFAFLLMRRTLARIGLLHNLFGISFLYLSAALPVFTFLSMATTYDSLVYFFAAATLALSVELFWEGDPFSLTNPRQRNLAAMLLGIFVLGLLTKYSCLLHFAIPFFVLAARYRRATFVKNAAAALAVCAISGALVMPFYYGRYYREHKQWMPLGADFFIGYTLDSERAKRDEHPLRFLLHILRPPPLDFGQKDPVTDSVFHELWYEIWKNDQAHAGAMLHELPTVYAYLFIVPMLSGMLFFAFRCRKQRSDPLVGFGMTLAACALLFGSALVYFGYENPYFPWRYFKAIYVPLTVLWVTFCCACAMLALSRIPRSALLRATVNSGLLLLIAAFVVINHTVPY